LDILLHILVTLALIPGSLLFVAVLVWRAARAATGFSKPSLPLRSSTGSIVCTEADWHRHMKAEYPYHYAAFESFPMLLRRLGRLAVRTFSLKTVRESILSGAFRTFASWVEFNWDDIQDFHLLEGEEGPRAQHNVRMAEIRCLYLWWTEVRPERVRRHDEASLDHRERDVLDSELDDQIHLARLANVWRDLT
jgi:hypothetical protein